MSEFFKELNFNPFRKKIPDCAIRAVAAGLAVRYSAVCGILGRRFQIGHGMVGNGGIDLEEIKNRFGKFCDIIEDARYSSYEFRPAEFDNAEFDPMIDQDEDFGYTLDEFCRLYAGQGRFLVALTTGHVSRYIAQDTACHVVLCDLNPGNNFFIDTWDCGSMNVQAFMRIKKIWPPSDPNSLLYGKTVGK